MSATYRVTEQDYVRAMRLYARPTTVGRILLAAGALALIGVALLGTPVARNTAIGGLAGGCGMWLAIRASIPWSARRHYRKYKAMHDAFTVELREEGVHFASTHGQATLVWSNILKWRQDAHYVLMYPMPRMFHILPTAIASQGFDLDALTRRLLEHVGKPV